MGEGKNLIADLAGISEPLKKLIETVESGIGRVFKSTFTRKDADAKAYEIRTLAAARADAIKLLSEGMKAAAPGTGGLSLNDDGMSLTSLPAHEQDRLPNLPTLSLEGRTQDRQAFQESVRQQNIESITAIAAEQLGTESDVSSEPVDPDWTARFFRYSEDISNEEMQNIWGRVLADEVKHPGSFSYRALELIRNITPKEAQLFSSIASRISRLTPTDYGYVTTDQYKLSAADKLSLAESGLFGGIGDALSITLQHSMSAGIENQGHLMQLTNRSDKTVRISFMPITSAGRELSSLISVSLDEEYIKGIARHFAQKGCEVKYGPIITRRENGTANQFMQVHGWLDSSNPAT